MWQPLLFVTPSCTIWLLQYLTTLFLPHFELCSCLHRHQPLPHTVSAWVNTPFRPELPLSPVIVVT